MTPAEWKEVELDLSHPYGTVQLVADGHKITAQVQRMKSLRYCVVVFIDGQIDWKLCHAKEPGDIHKFWRPRKKFLYSAAKRADAAKKAKMRGMPADIKRIWNDIATAAIESLDPAWPDAKAWCSHLRKHCTSVARVTMDAEA